MWCFKKLCMCMCVGERRVFNSSYLCEFNLRKWLILNRNIHFIRQINENWQWCHDTHEWSKNIKIQKLIKKKDCEKEKRKITKKSSKECLSYFWMRHWVKGGEPASWNRIYPKSLETRSLKPHFLGEGGLIADNFSCIWLIEKKSCVFLSQIVLLIASCRKTMIEIYIWRFDSYYVSSTKGNVITSFNRVHF